MISWELTCRGFSLPVTLPSVSVYDLFQLGEFFKGITSRVTMASR